MADFELGRPDKPIAKYESGDRLQLGHKMYSVKSFQMLLAPLKRIRGVLSIVSFTPLVRPRPRGAEIDRLVSVTHRSPNLLILFADFRLFAQ